jgi:type IV pilus assembly protein PilW
MTDLVAPPSLPPVRRAWPLPGRRAAQAGATLIELMVGVVIGMLAVLVIAQVALVYEGQKRSTTSGSDAQVNGALALQTLQRDIQMSGYGITSGLSAVGGAAMPAAGCPIRATLGGLSAPQAPQLLAPVVIDNGADGAPDKVHIMSSGQANFSVPIPVAGPLARADVIHASTDTAFVLPTNKNVGNAQGDLMLAVHVPDGTNSGDCTLFNINMNGMNQLVRVGAVESEGTTPLGADIAAGTPLFENTAPVGGLTVGPRLGHVSDATPSGLWNGGTPLFPLKFNAPVDPLKPNSYLINLGQPAKFIYRSYSVGANGLSVLMFNAGTGGTSSQDIYSGIVSLQAVYGKALGATDPLQASVWNADDPALDTADSSGAVIKGWSRVVAVRIAVVARSQQYEKTEVTPSLPQWHPDGVTATDLKIDTSTSTDWKHYRYKVYESVVPLRNMIWQS